MPVYEYKCDSCGNVFEVRQKFSDAPLTIHEGCGGHLEKILSAPAVHFKGTGWYVTDYARNSKDSKDSNEPKESKADSSDTKTGDGGKKTETKSDGASSATPAPAAPSSSSPPAEKK